MKTKNQPTQPLRIKLWSALLLLNLGGPLVLGLLIFFALPPIVQHWQEQQRLRVNQKILHELSSQAEHLLSQGSSVEVSEMSKMCQLWLASHRQLLFVSVHQGPTTLCQAGLSRSQRAPDIEFDSFHQKLPQRPLHQEFEPSALGQLDLEILRSRDFVAPTGFLGLGVMSLLLVLSFGLLLFLANSMLFFQLIHRPLKEFSRLVAQRNFTALAKFEPDWGILKLAEIEDFLNETKKVAQEVLRAEKSHKNLLRQKALLAVAQQVSHDIQSPLSALNLVLHQLPHISGEHKSLLQATVKRIQQIVQDLVPKGLQQNPNRPAILIGPILKTLLREKQLEHQAVADLKLELQDLSQDKDRVRVEDSALSRIISNLINNSVDAGARQIEVRVKPLCSSLVIEVKDDGKGMPRELISQLGRRPLSHGKASGSGLGLYSAFKVLESWGGVVEIDSQLDTGTSVRLILPSDCESFESVQTAPQRTPGKNSRKGSDFLEIYSGQSVTLSPSPARCT